MEVGVITEAVDEYGASQGLRQLDAVESLQELVDVGIQIIAGGIVHSVQQGVQGRLP